MAPPSVCLPEDQKERIEYELRGKTLQVYFYLLRSGGAAGVREVQKELGFSSPSVAFHHLDKLINLGIVERDQYERYVVTKKVDAGILSAFVNVGKLTLPRLGFYAAFFTTIALAYLLADLHVLDLYALIGTVGGAAVFWYEAWRVWRKKPF